MTAVTAYHREISCLEQLKIWLSLSQAVFLGAVYVIHVYVSFFQAWQLISASRSKVRNLDYSETENISVLCFFKY